MARAGPVANRSRHHPDSAPLRSRHKADDRSAKEAAQTRVKESLPDGAATHLDAGENFAEDVTPGPSPGGGAGLSQGQGAGDVPRRGRISGEGPSAGRARWVQKQMTTPQRWPAACGETGVKRGAGRWSQELVTRAWGWLGMASGLVLGDGAASGRPRQGWYVGSHLGTRGGGASSSASCLPALTHCLPHCPKSPSS